MQGSYLVRIQAEPPPPRPDTRPPPAPRLSREGLRGYLGPMDRAEDEEPDKRPPGAPSPLPDYERPTMPWERKAESSGRAGAARWAGAGIELAASLVVLGALGWWLDGRLGTGPWLAVGLGMLGLVGGLVRFVRRALAAVAEDERAGDAARKGDRSPPR